MQQLTSELQVIRSGGVNPRTAIAIFVSVALVATVTFIFIAEMVYGNQASSPARAGTEEGAPAVLRPATGEELAAVEATPTEEPAVNGTAEATVEAEARRDRPPTKTRPAVRPGPRTDTPSSVEAPRPTPTETLFGADGADPLGGLDFGPSING